MPPASIPEEPMVRRPKEVIIDTDPGMGAAKGSQKPQLEKVGKVTQAQVRAIAEEKLPDLNCASVEAAMRIIAGTAATMGIDIDPPILEKKEKVLV